MDLIKIGKFISTKRKELGITQSELAEKLNITDRAISKWENGVCLPDAGNMPDLCKILNITINDLFSGEVVDMKDYNKRSDELLLEMKKKEEMNNRKQFADMWVLLIITLIAYLTIIFISCNTLEEGFTLGTIICCSTAVFVCVCFYAFRTEVYVGYYECNKCHHKYVPTYSSVFWAMHMGRTRYMKCPKCNKYSWNKKVISKE